MMFDIDISKLIPWVLGLAVLLGTGWAVKSGIDNWQEATAKAATDAARVLELEGLLSAKEEALTAAGERLKVLEAKAEADALLLTQRNTEIAAAQAALNIQKRKYQNALELLEGADLECALRTVPPAVDWLLDRTGTQAAPTGDREGASASGSDAEASPPYLLARSPVG